MGLCIMCGSQVPDGQRICSMCYGDPWYGRDGYYLKELESEARRGEMKMARGLCTCGYSLQGETVCPICKADYSDLQPDECPEIYADDFEVSNEEG